VTIEKSPGHDVGGDDVKVTWLLTREAWLARRADPNKP
jgi:hypothetical protein